MTEKRAEENFLSLLMRARLAGMAEVVGTKHEPPPSALAREEASKVIDLLVTALGSDIAKWTKVGMGATVDGGVMFEVADMFEIWVEPDGQLLTRSDVALPASPDEILKRLRSLSAFSA